LFHERQACDSRHRLGHGGKREHGIERHRPAFFRIELPIDLVLDKLSVPCNCDHCARHPLLGDLAGEEII
jgi:hypothetical protein